MAAISLIQFHYRNHHINVVQKFYRNLNPFVSLRINPESRLNEMSITLNVPVVYGHRGCEIIRTVSITVFIPNSYPFESLSCYINNIGNLSIRPWVKVNPYNGKVNIMSSTIGDRNPGSCGNHDLIEYIKFIVPWLQSTPRIIHRNVDRKKVNECKNVHQSKAKCELIN